MQQANRSNVRGSRWRRFSMLLTVGAASLTMSACAGNPWWLPAAHQITIQQGNLVDEERLATVTSGMPREQVRSVLGSPIAASPFDSDRWDYLFTRGPAGEAIPARRVSVFFSADRVERVEDNLDSVSGEKPPQSRWWEFFSRNRT